MTMFKSFRSRILGLIWKLRPWISVCSNCQRWRPKESSDEAAWMYPYKDYPPHTPKVSHGLCAECCAKLYPDMARNSEARHNGG